jgi:cytochrome c2
MRLPLAGLLALLALPRGPEPARDGKALFLELGCVHCHAEAQPGALLRESPAGPDLRRAGARLTRGFLQQWLCDPSAWQPRARMPAMFGDDAQGRQDALDVAAWLEEAGGPCRTTARAWDRDEGEKRFRQRGCIACHVTGEDQDDGRIPLRRLAHKTGLDQLAAYLEKPLAVHPRGLMPDLQLDRKDAEVIAAWLHGNEKPQPQPEPKGDPARGERIACELRCASCHALPPARVRSPHPSPPPPPPLAALRGKTAGCLAETPPAGVPRYRLDAAARAALEVFLADPARNEAPADQLARRLAALRCDRCHRTADGGGMPAEVARAVREAIGADQPEHMQAPDLDSASQRLRPSWIADVLERHARGRPYLELRMPRYAPDLVAGLAALLSATAPAEEASVPPHDLQDVENGRLLTGSGGLGCITCHDVRGNPATGLRGPDLALAQRRLRPEYLRRWLEDPAAVQPGTRMPSYFRNGRSTLPTVLDGDAGRQLHALLCYLAQGERLVPPAGFEPLRDGVLDCDHGLRVVRTILPGLDPRSLAIGFHNRLSLAFDVSRPALGYVWSGGFLDMRRTWTGRGNGSVDLVGGKLVDGLAEPLLDARFGGYDVEPEAVTLRFLVEGGELRLRIATVTQPAGHGLRLEAETTAQARLLPLLPAASAAPALAEQDRKLFALRTSGPLAFAAGTALEVDGRQRLLLRVPARGRAALTVWFPGRADEETLRRCLSH